MDETGLSQRTRNAIREGKLPTRTPDHTWGGPGIGALCAVCDLPVPRAGMQFEIQCALHGNAPDFDVYHVHTGCGAAWELERPRPARWPCRGELRHPSCLRAGLTSRVAGR